MSKNPDDFLIKPDLDRPSTWKFRIFANGEIDLDKLDFAFALLSDSPVLVAGFGLTYKGNDKGTVLAQISKILLSSDRDEPSYRRVFRIAIKWGMQPVEGYSLPTHYCY